MGMELKKEEAALPPRALRKQLVGKRNFLTSLFSDPESFSKSATMETFLAKQQSKRNSFFFFFLKLLNR